MKNFDFDNADLGMILAGLVAIVALFCDNNDLATYCIIGILSLASGKSIRK